MKEKDQSDAGMAKEKLRAHCPDLTIGQVTFHRLTEHFWFTPGSGQDSIMVLQASVSPMPDDVEALKAA